MKTIKWEDFEQLSSWYRPFEDRMDIWFCFAKYGNMKVVVRRQYESNEYSIECVLMRTVWSED